MLRPSLFLACLLAASVAGPLAHAQTPAPVPPADLVSAPAPVAADEIVPAPIPVSQEQLTQVPSNPCEDVCLSEGCLTGCCDGNSCCSAGCYIDPCAHHGYGICHHSRFRCFRCLHSTCDMYPHYAYYPEHHGYYYFRPYNYMNVFDHIEKSMQMGGSPWHPYSVSMFADIPHPAVPLDPTALGSEEPAVNPTRVRLPILEDLLGGE